ncbi:MAG: tRNA (adenosine(37)-N6)-dimethylallyltransferase MiaA [Actinomycetota bacterium]|jgi:tRNA dimethylallyltransferase|nr:tRNA (adenosine(37)-N6)-dimethylallyltransferase MiaA [Actinomycetota bacterium]
MSETDDSRSQRVVAVVGPTAVGKTTLAEDLAVLLHGEVISADSMQVYRGMNVGTAKPPQSERRVPYHCLDLADPSDDFSAALFQRCARAAIEEIADRNKLPILAGGTGLYIRAALDDMHFPAGDTRGGFRAQLEARAEVDGAEAMHARLFEVDPSSAELIHPNNLRRTIRALEMVSEGASYAEQAAGFEIRESIYDTVFIGLTMDREALYRRIDARVDHMIASGLLNEVQKLLRSNMREAITAQQAIGYKEFVSVLENGADMNTAIDDVKRSTRRYAKRQMTWFRGDPRVQWIDVTDLSPNEVTRHAIELLDSLKPEFMNDSSKTKRG